MTNSSGPFAGLLLADYGASILRIDRPHPSAHTLSAPPPTADVLVRNKTSIALDLKSAGGLLLLRKILEDADVLIDPYRPGVIESMGLRPSELLAANQRLIVARLTGFRRDGKYSAMAGHDINYLAVSGVLSQLGRKGSPPSPPANILADFAGGGLMCALGIMMALFAREKSGKGQVVESNMVDGSAYLATMMRLGTKTPLWDKQRGENLLDGGSPFYDVYECKDGGYMAVGALEPQFFSRLLRGLELPIELQMQQHERDSWDSMRELFRGKFKQKTRKQWEAVFDGKDACCTPVLSQRELERAEYKQRQAVALSKTPGREIDQSKAWKSAGMSPGFGGEKILLHWMGWSRGIDYEVKHGALILSQKAKL